MGGPATPMSEIGQVNSELTQAVWTDEAGRSATVRPTMPGIALTLLGVLVVTVLIGGLMLHQEVTKALSMLGETGSHGAASEASLQTARQLGQWQLTATLFTATCGVILIALAVAGNRRVENHWERQREKENSAWERLVRDLRGQIGQKQKLETGLREQNHEFQKQLETTSRAHREVKEQLEQIKLAREQFVHQRSELVRSKDVLELHVRARTQQLEKLQREYALILNSAGEGICGFDINGKVTFANPAAAKMMGAQVTEVIGRHAREVFPQFVQPSITAANGHHNPVEVVATRIDGSKFVAEFIRTPIQEGERAVGEVLMFKDITERTQAADRLAKKAEELARSNAELEKFAFVASHDLQEPLRKIQAFGDRLKAKCDEANLKEGRDYLERMQSAAARMQTLIYDLLSFSRVIRRTEAFAPIDLNTIAREILVDLEVRIEKSGGRVEVGALPTLEADGTQMRQLLQNLIGNALKFHLPSKPPVVRVESRKLPAGPTGENGPPMDGEWCEVSVSDNGIGFDEKYLDRIFEVFQRLHSRQEYEGTGMGLAICRRIVDRHGGRITARSTPGEGASFLITLPLRQPAKQDPEHD